MSNQQPTPGTDATASDSFTIKPGSRQVEKRVRFLRSPSFYQMAAGSPDTAKYLLAEDISLEEFHRRNEQSGMPGNSLRFHALAVGASSYETYDIVTVVLIGAEGQEHTFRSEPLNVERHFTSSVHNSGAAGDLQLHTFSHSDRETPRRLDPIQSDYREQNEPKWHPKLTSQEQSSEKVGDGDHHGRQGIALRTDPLKPHSHIPGYYF